jgi:hypothetical protein
LDWVWALDGQRVKGPADFFCEFLDLPLSSFFIFFPAHFLLGPQPIFLFFFRFSQNAPGSSFFSSFTVSFFHLSSSLLFSSFVHLLFFCRQRAAALSFSSLSSSGMDKDGEAVATGEEIQPGRRLSSSGMDWWMKRRWRRGKGVARCGLD